MQLLQWLKTSLHLHRLHQLDGGSIPTLLPFYHQLPAWKLLKEWKRLLNWTSPSFCLAWETIHTWPFTSPSQIKHARWDGGRQSELHSEHADLKGLPGNPSQNQLTVNRLQQSKLLPMRAALQCLAISDIHLHPPTSRTYTQGFHSCLIDTVVFSSTNTNDKGATRLSSFILRQILA